MTWLQSGFAGLVIAMSSSAARPEEEWRVLDGARLQQLFTNKQLADDAHYAYEFRRDGTFAGVEMGKDVRGTWKTTPHMLCWTWIKPRGSEECYEVRRSGNDVRLFRNGYEALSGTLTPLRSKTEK